MLLELYIFLSGITAVLLMLGWNDRRNIFFLWIPIALCASLAVLSLDIQVLRCEVVTTAVNSSIANYDVLTTEWSCHTYDIHEYGLAWFWWGLFFIQFGIAAVITMLIFTGTDEENEGGDNIPAT